MNYNMKGPKRGDVDFSKAHVFHYPFPPPRFPAGTELNVSPQWGPSLT
jgi:hypothetical protein